MTFPNDVYYLRRLVDQVPAVLAYWDKDLRCRFANCACTRWFGVGADELSGIALKDLLGADLFAQSAPYIAGVLAGHEQVFERIVPGPKGMQRNSLITYVPDFSDGAVVGFVVHVAETTTLKNAEAARRASERRFRALAESSPFGIYETDAQGRRIYTNSRWQEIYGLYGERSLSADWVNLISAEDREVVLAARDRTVATGCHFDIVFRINRPCGQVRLIHSRGHPLTNDDGELSGFVGAVEDITEQRLAEERLRASESLLDRTGRLAGVGGWQVDLRSGHVTWSDHTRRIHDVDGAYRPSLEGALEFYPEEARSVLRLAVDAAVEQGVPWDLELPFVSARGRSLWVRTLGDVERENGIVVRLIGAFQDITEPRRRQAELAREQQLRVQSELHARELDRLLQERGEMLDVMAHEVRQPLNNASAALQSAASAMRETGATAASDRLSRAQKVMGTVLASIDNTLAVASLLARPDSIQKIETDIDMMLAVAIADMPSAERSRVQVVRHTDAVTALVDMSLMRLALRNVLSNALKYSGVASDVTVGVAESEDDLALVLEVADHGPGLADQAMSHLFERASRRNRREVAGGSGLGLGLYIVRRVMELHGGRAELSRNGPEGATIRLTVPRPADG